jgi:hypothetical protein
MELLNVNNSYEYLLVQKEQGRYIELPYNIITSEISELTEKVRGWLIEFDCPYVLYHNEEAQELLDELSEELENNESFYMPMDGSDDFFIKLTDNVIVHIEAEDEYIGLGEHQTYSCINGLILNEQVTKEEIKEVVEWISKFNK